MILNVIKRRKLSQEETALKYNHHRHNQNSIPCLVSCIFILKTISDYDFRAEEKNINKLALK